MNRSLSILLTVFTLLASACQFSGSESPVATQNHEASQVARSDIGFASKQKLQEHYEKHGSEFGAISLADYLRQAQLLRDRPVGGSILEIKRDDGAVTRFDRATGAFLAFNRDLTIRTFFKPNDGERYFLRQANR